MPPPLHSSPLPTAVEVRVLTTHLCIQKHSGATFGYTLNILYFNCHLEGTRQSIHDFINTGNVRSHSGLCCSPTGCRMARVLAPEPTGDNVHRAEMLGAVGTAPNCTAAPNSLSKTLAPI